MKDARQLALDAQISTPVPRAVADAEHVEELDRDLLTDLIREVQADARAELEATLGKIERSLRASVAALDELQVKVAALEQRARLWRGR